VSFLINLVFRKNKMVMRLMILICLFIFCETGFFSYASDRRNQYHQPVLIAEFVFGNFVFSILVRNFSPTKLYHRVYFGFSRLPLVHQVLFHLSWDVECI